MAAEKTGGNSPDNNAKAVPHLKQMAQQYLNTSPRGTSSWQMLKDLRLSIVDGGVNILKSGVDKLTGTSRNPKPVSDTKQTASTQESATKESDKASTERNISGKTESEVVNQTQISTIESNHIGEHPTEAVGGDWVDYLMDSIGLDAVEAETPHTSPAAPSQNGTGQTLVERNEKLVVTKITYPNGASTSISYDQNDAPRPTLIVCSDGREWRREGARWFEYRAGQFSGEVLSGDFVIRDDGSIIKMNTADEPIEEWLANGDMLECPVDNPRVKKDGSGMVIEQAYPRRDGSNSLTYKYHQGRLIAVEMASGGTWLRQADGSWQRQGGRPHPFELNVSQCGDCVILKNGKAIAVQHRDGTETRVKWNGEKVWARDAHAIEIVHADGSYSQFSSAGRVTRDRNHNVISSTPHS